MNITFTHAQINIFKLSTYYYLLFSFCTNTNHVRLSDYYRFLKQLPCETVFLIRI